MELNVFYHIFVNEHLECLEIVKEQVNNIIKSKIYDKLNKIYCCVSGSNKKIYNLTLDYIDSLPSKFKLEKAIFNDLSHERLTLNTMKSMLKENSYYLYLHSKGVTRITENIYLNCCDWRRCMEYFLIENADKCIDKLNQGHTTVGIIYQTLPKKHYSGNFWWATGKYLIELFNKRTIEDGYHGPEMFLLSIDGNPYCMANYFDFSKRGFFVFHKPIRIDRKTYAIYD